MKKSIIIPAILIGSLITGSIAIAKPYGFASGNQFKSKGQGVMTEAQHAERVSERLERMDVILDLDDNQEKEIAALFDQRRQERQGNRGEMREGRDERRAAMRSGELDETAIRAHAAKRAEYKTDRMVERVELKKELYAILTPEQQEKAEKLWAGQGGKGKGQRGNGFRY